MKKFIFALIGLFLSLGSPAQVKNNAIGFERNGRLSLGVIDGMDSAQGATLQFWMNPKHWIPGANVVDWGETLNVALGMPGEIVVTSGT